MLKKELEALVETQKAEIAALQNKIAWLESQAKSQPAKAVAQSPAKAQEQVVARFTKRDGTVWEKIRIGFNSHKCVQIMPNKVQETPPW